MPFTLTIIFKSKHEGTYFYIKGALEFVAFKMV